MRIYSCSQILIWAFLTACTQASSMQRTSSVAHFDTYATVNDHWPVFEPGALLPQSVKKGEAIAAKIFFELGQIFGFKRYPAANLGPDAEEVISIDISWPNLRKVVLKKLSGVNATPIPYDVTPQSVITHSHLKWLLETWETSLDRIDGIFNNADPDEITSGLTQDQINLIWNICNERIFSLSALRNKDVEDTEKRKCMQDALETAVKTLLLTKSGVQRILSLIFVSLNSEYNNASLEYSPNRIQILEGPGSWDGFSQLSVNFGEHTDSIALTLFHEISHAYKSLIIRSWNEMDDETVTHLIAFTNYSIMNSPFVNFVREFYPMLSPANMKPATEAIEKWMKANSEHIFFKTGIDFRKDGDFSKITAGSTFFTNLLNSVQNLGFGNVIAGEVNSLSLAAKLIYIKSTWAIFNTDEDELDDSMKGKDNSRDIKHTLWGTFSYDEMLTMRGVMVAKFGQRTFLLEDRQNENIYVERLHKFLGISSDQFYSTSPTGKDSRRYHLNLNATMFERVVIALRGLVDIKTCNFDDLKNQLSRITIDPVVNKYVESSGGDMSYRRVEYDTNFQTQVLFSLANEFNANTLRVRLNSNNLVVPSNVKSLNLRVCENWRNLKTVSFEENAQVTAISYGAFANCCDLVSIKIPKSVNIIEMNAFCDCKSLETVEIENSSQLTKIEVNAFKGCTSLTSITIPASVRIIETRAFDDCPNLREIKFAPDSNLKVLDLGAFSGCPALKTIEIPNKVELIQNTMSYSNTSAITSIIFTPNSSVRIIERCAFKGFPIAEISIPSSVEIIECEAFCECASLMRVKFGESSKIKHLNLAAFCSCSSLNELIIPASVEQVDGMSSILVISSNQNYGARIIKFSPGSQLNTIGAYAFATPNLQRIFLPEELKVIGEHAFEASSLKEICIPKTVTNIGMFAFFNCSQLQNIQLEQGVNPDIAIGKRAIGIIRSPSGGYRIAPSLSRIIIPYSLKNNSDVKALMSDLARKKTNPVSIEWVGDVLNDQQPD
ncbi:MAG: leucine-rich repeat domain-containing protein [Holosporales bacterium]|nr:leucine-rich repeat domain-containing protein [Holosporales bacterium]